MRSSDFDQVVPADEQAPRYLQAPGDRSSNNSKTDEALGRGPGIPLREGLLSTYRWIESELRTAGKMP